MRKSKDIAILCLLILAGLKISAWSGPESGQSEGLVLTGYPDPSESLIVKVMAHVAKAYEQAHPDSPGIRVEPGLNYRSARNWVADGEADGMLITEQVNQTRAAIIFERGRDQRGRGFKTLKLNRFVPLATRVIRSESEVLDKVRLGVATHEITSELREFLAFLSSERGRAAIRKVRYMEPVERLAEPRPISAVPYKSRELALGEPILTYLPATE